MVKLQKSFKERKNTTFFFLLFFLIFLSPVSNVEASRHSRNSASARTAPAPVQQAPAPRQAPAPVSRPAPVQKPPAPKSFFQSAVNAVKSVTQSVVGVVKSVVQSVVSVVKNIFKSVANTTTQVISSVKNVFSPPVKEVTKINNSPKTSTNNSKQTSVNSNSSQKTQTNNNSNLKSSTNNSNTQVMISNSAPVNNPTSIQTSQPKDKQSSTSINLVSVKQSTQENKQILSKPNIVNNITKVNTDSFKVTAIKKEIEYLRYVPYFDPKYPWTERIYIKKEKEIFEDLLINNKINNKLFQKEFIYITSSLSNFDRSILIKKLQISDSQEVKNSEDFISKYNSSIKIQRNKEILFNFIKLSSVQGYIGKVSMYGEAKVAYFYDRNTKLLVLIDKNTGEFLRDYKNIDSKIKITKK